MAEIFNIYCDESCHLENDKKPVMVLGAVWCPYERVREISRNIRDIKLKHGLSKSFEIKWTKVSPGKLTFYLDLVDYFFSDLHLHFRGVVIDKSKLNHSMYDQSHDDWYYKMFFVLLKEIIDPLSTYRIYIDIKDTRSEVKRAKLEQVLRNHNYDATGDIIKSVQQIRSHESQTMQLADLLIGGLRYCNEQLTNASMAKSKLIERIQQRSGKTLLQTTWPKESKFNVLIWRPGGGER